MTALAPGRMALNQPELRRFFASTNGRKYLNSSIEVVVFGSMSVGLQRPDSDIDVLLVGNDEYRIKNAGLHLIAITQETTRSPRWLESELASHIAEYGNWILGTSLWKRDVHIGSRAIANKRRRIIAFLKALGGKWACLDPIFQDKYSVKLRREVQRLLLLERRTSVPPTKILDCFWDDAEICPSEVHNRLDLFTATSNSAFRVDLMGRIDAFFRENVRSGELENQRNLHRFTGGR